MERRHRLTVAGTCVAAIGLLVIGSPSPAEARSEDDVRLARVAIGNGTDHFRAGRYNEAITEFRKALATLREPGLIWNIGRCYDELGDAVNAVHHYRTLAVEFPDDESAREAKERVAELLPRLPGSLVVGCGRNVGAKVTIDGTREAQCGKRIDGLDPGVHDVAASLPGGLRWSRRVRIEPEARRDVEVEWGKARAQPPVGARTSSEHPAPGRWGAVVAVALGAAAAGAGGWFAIEARRQEDERDALLATARTTPQPSDVVMDLDEGARDDALLANILLGAGAAAVVTGVVLWLRPRPDASGEPAGVGLALTPQGLALVGRWSP